MGRISLPPERHLGSQTWPNGQKVHQSQASLFVLPRRLYWKHVDWEFRLAGASEISRNGLPGFVQKALRGRPDWPI